MSLASSIDPLKGREDEGKFTDISQNIHVKRIMIPGV